MALTLLSFGYGAPALANSPKDKGQICNESLATGALNHESAKGVLEKISAENANNFDHPEKAAIENALDKPSHTLEWLSPLRSRSRPLATAFFVRLFDSENDDHIRQVLQHFREAFKIYQTSDLRTGMLQDSLGRLKSSILEAAEQGYLDEVLINTPEKLIAHILSAGSANYSDIPYLLALEVVKMSSTEESGFDLSAIVKSRDFQPPFLVEDTHSLTHMVILRGMPLQHVEDIDLLSKYWSIVSSTDIGTKEFLETAHAALVASVEAIPDADKRSVLRMTKLFQTLSEFGKQGDYFDELVTGILARALNHLDAVNKR